MFLFDLLNVGFVFILLNVRPGGKGGASEVWHKIFLDQELKVGKKDQTLSSF